jgi:peptidoglycan hydrolase-like protein with peptidoglycan-binding domain
MSIKRLLLATSVAAFTASGAAFAADDGMSKSGAAAGTMSSSSGTSAPSGAATTQANISQAQTALKEKGLYKGPVDGQLGPETRHAISLFQRQNGLKQTAQLDARTMRELSGGGARSGTGRNPAGTPNMPMGAPATGGAGGIR